MCVSQLRTIVSKLRTPTPSTASPTASPAVAQDSPSATKSNPFLPYKGWTYFELVRRYGHGLSDEDIKLAKEAGVIFKEDPAPVGEADRSGNDLSDGGVRTFVLSDGQEQVVTFNRAGTIYVFGASGTQLRSVTDSNGTFTPSGTVSRHSYRVYGPGSYAFSVTSTGGNIAAQLV